MDRTIIFTGILAITFLVICPVQAVTEKVILYQSDFSSSPNWTTNNPSRYYWNETDGTYHYFVEGGTNGYAIAPPLRDIGSFVLEFDIVSTRTDKDSAFRLGITGSSDMNINKGPSVYAEFSNKHSVPSMWLRVITQNNNMYEIGSMSSAYPGETKEFRDGVPYHVTVRYQQDRDTIDIKVNEKENNTPVWGYYLQIDRELNIMDQLVISSVGDYGNIGKSAEGYVDNISLYTYEEVIPTATAVTPAVTTTLPTTDATTIPTSVVPTTTKAPLVTSLVIVATVMTGFLSVSGRRKI